MTLALQNDSTSATPELLFKDDSVEEAVPLEDLVPSDNVFRFVTDCV